MPAFARNKFLWLALLLGFSAAAFGAWWQFADRGGALFFGRYGTSFWTVTSFAGKPVEPDTLLLFDEGQLALDGECGAQQWVYERDDDSFEISRTSGATSRCVVAPTPLIIVQFSAVRTTVTALKIDGHRLTMRDGQGMSVLEAERLLATGLENRTWRISRFRLDNKMTATSDAFGESAQVHITLIKGSIYGYAGCRYLLGRYTRLDPEWVHFDAEQHPATTCHQRDIDLADAIITALSAGHRMTREKDRVILVDDEGDAQVVLTPWPTQPMP
jgi:hypothetical protein